MAEMVVEPEDAFPLPRESGLFGDGGEGTDIERDAVRFLAAFKGILHNTLQLYPTPVATSPSSKQTNTVCMGALIVGGWSIRV